MNRTYFSVSGQRALYQEDKEGRARRVGTSQEVFLRYESLEQPDAEHFATAVYRSEQIICTIDEVTR